MWSSVKCTVMGAFCAYKLLSFSVICFGLVSFRVCKEPNKGKRQARNEAEIQNKHDSQTNKMQQKIEVISLQTAPMALHRISTER